MHKIKKSFTFIRSNGEFKFKIWVPLHYNASGQMHVGDFSFEVKTPVIHKNGYGQKFCMSTRGCKRLFYRMYNEKKYDLLEAMLINRCRIYFNNRIERNLRTPSYNSELVKTASEGLNKYTCTKTK